MTLQSHFAVLAERSSEKPLKAETLIARVTPEQKSLVAGTAEKLDITEAQFMRRAIIKALADTALAA